ncbi:MAG: hypothetical protein [Podoviridae sp. ctLUJ1]|nr:MAG: hypothetical protein [Podoviridae sp. ctLUJ1]
MNPYGVSKEEAIAECKQRIEGYKKNAERLAMLDRLIVNPDFVALIEEDYFKARPVRLVMAKGNPSMDSADSQARLVREMDGIAMLRQYFHVIETEGSIAPSMIEREREQIEELESEVEGDYHE